MQKLQSDIILLEKIKKGDAKAFEHLFGQYWDLLFNAAYGRLKATDLAKDVVQEVFIDLWNRREKLQVTFSLETYLLTAVKYNIFKVIDQVNLEEGLNADSGMIPMPDEDVLPLEELYNQLEVALEMLPEMAANIFRMNKLQGMSATDVAQELDINVQSVHNSVHKSMKLLRKSLRYTTVSILFL
ncbi:RNA polymerase sigma factor [Rhodonellum sp.]|uniref:RNA polymerase sigma factor n=1 Tax=Rhodonellum sp. TaxID=2231180 RepID=UPI002728CED0|nr:sigma-70 family RNA polymerase sigma factor [Rhodonellum sp.]MDO9553286.1 sigma-70 family RNA polymerase sigma factor [Rhodonellum sp.]